jgi:monoamine oxidase
VSQRQFEVIVIGAGAAGIAATRRLVDAGVSVLLVEARGRIGGRAHTVVTASGDAIDLGCGWLHSADVNPWCGIAEKLGFAIDRTLAPWHSDGPEIGQTRSERQEFRAAMDRFWESLEATEGEDRPASALLDPACGWNPLIDAISTYINGAELDQISVLDWARYHDSGIDWRLPRGYGALITHYGQDLPIELDCTVTRIDHAASAIEVDTSRGRLQAEAVVLALPTDVLAAGAVRFDPELPEKLQAAADLPLGNDEKAFLALRNAEALPSGARFFGGNKVATGGYHVRPFGRPMIEAYFGGNLARDLAKAGPAAMAAFAIEEIAGVCGHAIREKLSLIEASGWAADPFARGSYSHALPGRAVARAVLAAPVDGRLFFAGEACSPHDFSTAHGAYESGLTAAEAYLAGR